MKTIDLNTKRRTFIDGAVKGIDSKRRTIRAYASTNAWDRYGERFEADAFKDGLESYKKNPVVLFAHDYSAPPIAKAIDFSFDSKGLILEMQFAETEQAKEVFALYEGGFMNAFSVGFRPLEVAFEERAPGEMGAVFKKAELLENSAVPVPANPEAVVVRGIGGKSITLSGEVLRAMILRAYRSDDQIKAEEEPVPGTPEVPAAEAPTPPIVPEPSPEPVQAEEPAAADPDIKKTLGLILAQGKTLLGAGKVTEEGTRSLLVQTVNLCRELVLGPGTESLDGAEEMSPEEMAALVREYELLSEKVAKSKSATDKDRAELEEIGKLIERAIQGETI